MLSASLYHYFYVENHTIIVLLWGILIANHVNDDIVGVNDLPSSSNVTRQFCHSLSLSYTCNANIATSLFASIDN